MFIGADVDWVRTASRNRNIAMPRPEQHPATAQLLPNPARRQPGDQHSDHVRLLLLVEVGLVAGAAGQPDDLGEWDAIVRQDPVQTPDSGTAVMDLGYGT
jgi:hypothetical protein